MFLFKKGRFLYCNKAINTSHSVPVNTPPIKMPYGNIYSIGGMYYSAIDMLVSCSRQHRASVSKLLPQQTNALGVVLDHTGTLYLLSKGFALHADHDGLILNVFHLTHDFEDCLASDFDHLDMLQALMEQNLELEEISKISPTLFRSLPNTHVIVNTDDVLTEMRNEGRTISLIDHILISETKLN